MSLWISSSILKKNPWESADHSLQNGTHIGGVAAGAASATGSAWSVVRASAVEGRQVGQTSRRPGAIGCVPARLVSRRDGEGGGVVFVVVVVASAASVFAVVFSCCCSRRACTGGNPRPGSHRTRHRANYTRPADCANNTASARTPTASQRARTAT